MKPEPSDWPLAILGLLLLLPAVAAIEQVFERRASKGVAARLHLDPLAGGNIDHRRLELRGQIGEAGRGAGARHHAGYLGVVVLRDLRTRRIPGEGQGGAAGKQGGSYGIGITHRVCVLYHAKTVMAQVMREQLPQNRAVWATLAPRAE